MNIRINVPSIVAASVTLWMGIFSANAGAATQSRQIVSLPTNYCQSSLPTFEGLIRKRPLAVQNEGSASAFITCSYPSGEGREPSSSATTRVWQYFLNNSDTNITVSCTGVSGDTGAEQPQYIVKSLEIPANTPVGNSQISWFAADFAGAPAVFPSQGQFSISCSIPPGGGVRQAYINSITDVGT